MKAIGKFKSHNSTYKILNSKSFQRTIYFKSLITSIILTIFTASNILKADNYCTLCGLKKFNIPWKKSLLIEEFEKEIRLFKKLGFREYDGKSVFNVDFTNLSENQKRSRIFLAYIKQVNICLLNYKAFAGILRNCYVKPFVLRFVKEFKEPEYKKALARTHTDWSGIEFRSCSEKYYFELQYKDIFYRPRVNFDKVVASIAAHEVGHVIQLMIRSIKFESNKNPPTSQQMKEDIISKALKIDKNTTGFISKYGEVNPTEWFAEVFTNLQCSRNPNSLAKALDEYLKEYIKKYFRCYL